MMTAANLGARVTGWGFVVFTIGSIAWSSIGYLTGQANLIATNLFLTIVNMVGIWRWLGRQKVYEDGGKSAAIASERSAAPSLFTATGISGMQVTGENGEHLGHAVEALLECRSGCVSYVVVASHGATGFDEQLRAVSRGLVDFGSDGLHLKLGEAAFLALPLLAPGNWPALASCPVGRHV